MPQQFVARIVEREAVTPHQAIIWLALPRRVVEAAAPGQFLLLGPERDRQPLLQPFGIMRATRGGPGSAEGTLEILAFTGGRTVGWLAEGQPDDRWAGIGPLGHGYTLGERVRQALLIAVGHGVAPLVALARTALARGVAVTMLLGARGGGDLLPLRELPEDAEIVVATDDGSRGYHGPVTDLVTGYLEWADAIYAYAPEPVYSALRDALRRYRGVRVPPPVQVATERPMACGVGVCLGCVIETTKGLRTVCRDGPVFPLDSLVLE